MIPLTYKALPQPWLFPAAGNRQFKSPAEIRNWVGDFCEELTAVVTGARRISTDGTRSICPDLHWFDNTFIESKGVGKTKHVIVYRVRMDRDIEFVQAGHDLWYFIWHHKARCYEVGDMDGLHRVLLEEMKCLYVVPFAEMVRATEGIALRVLNTSYTKNGRHRLGYGQKGYGDGWSIGLHILQKICQREIDFNVRGKNIKVYW